METGYVTSKGLLVIPAKLRRKFGIKTGTRVNFFEEKDGIKIIPVATKTITANKGFLGTGGSLLDSLMKEKKKEREL